MFFQRTAETQQKNKLAMRVLSTQKTIIKQSSIQKPDTVKILWGEPTWYFFHTIAHKVKNEHFDILKFQIFEIFKQICYNLPCPNCSIHAKLYIQKINFNSIVTKEDFKKMLFIFHNVINEKKNYPIFKYEDLDNKYSKSVTLNIIKNFFIFYQDKQYNVKLVGDNFHRNRIIYLTKKWFNQNFQYFDV
jgi:hypothetical protein